MGTLLAVRFALAAVLFWAPGVAPAASRLRALLPARRRLALALGAIGYAPRPAPTSRRSSGSTRRCSSLLVYTFPVIVTVAAIALGRERAEPPDGASRWRSPRPASCSSWRAPATGALDALGTALGLGRRASSTAPTS